MSNVINRTRSARDIQSAGEPFEPKARKKVSAEQFVEGYMRCHRQGGTAADVAEQLGMTVPAVTSRTSYLRKAGVRLPALPRCRIAQHDIQRLNRLVDAALRKE